MLAPNGPEIRRLAQLTSHRDVIVDQMANHRPDGTNTGGPNGILEKTDLSVPRSAENFDLNCVNLINDSENDSASIRFSK